MGMQVSELKRLTFWEYAACVDGWNRAQGPRHAVEGDPMTDAEYDALSALGDMWNGR